MEPTPARLSASEAAARLGVSMKALRLYERRGLLDPVRSAAGWRTYGPEEMRRAGEIAGLRALGLGLAEVGSVLNGDDGALASVLAVHQSALDDRRRALSEMIENVRRLRDNLARGQTPSLANQLDDSASDGTVLSFELPWPWGGERFTFKPIRSLTYITGPLGCGKTRFAIAVADALPNSVFLGLGRRDEMAATRARWG